MKSFLKILFIGLVFGFSYSGAAEENWETLYQDARISRLAGDIDAALNLYNRALDTAPSPKTKIKILAASASLDIQAVVQDQDYDYYFTNAMETIDKAFSLFERTGEGQEYLLFLYHMKCAYGWRGDLGKKISESEHCTYAEKYEEHYEKLSGKDNFDLMAWEGSFWDDKVHHKDSNVSIPEAYSRAESDFGAIYFLFFGLPFDPEGKDTGIDFTYWTDEIREKYGTPMEQDQAHGKIFDPGLLSLRISFFEDVDMEAFAESFMANIADVSGAFDVKFETHHMKKKNWLTPEQGVYFVRYVKNQPSIYGDKMVGEVWAAQKGNKIIFLHLEYFQQFESGFLEAFYQFFEESNFDLNDHFDSIRRVHSQALPFCNDAPEEECIKPNYDTFPW